MERPQHHNHEGSAAGGNRQADPQGKNRKKNPPVNIGPPQVLCSRRGAIWAAAATLGLRPSLTQGQAVEANSHAGGALLRLAGQWKNMVVAMRILGQVWQSFARRGVILLVYPSDSELKAWQRFANLLKTESQPEILVHRPEMYGNDFVRGFPTDTWRDARCVRPDVVVVQDVYEDNWIEEIRRYCTKETAIVGNVVPYHHQPGIVFHSLDYRSIPEETVANKPTDDNPNPAPTILPKVEAGTLSWGRSEIIVTPRGLQVVPYYETIVNNYEPHGFGDVWARTRPDMSVHVEWVAASALGDQRLAYTATFVDLVAPLIELPLAVPLIAARWTEGSIAWHYVPSIVDDVAMRMAAAQGDKSLEATRSATATRLHSLRLLDLPYVHEHRAKLVEGTMREAGCRELPVIARSTPQPSYLAAAMDADGFRNTDPGLLEGVAWTFAATRAVDAVKRGLWTLWRAFCRAASWIASQVRNAPAASVLFGMFRQALRRNPVAFWPAFKRIWHAVQQCDGASVHLTDVTLITLVACLGILEEALKLVGWPVRLLVAVIEFAASWEHMSVGPQIIRLLVHVWCAFTPMPIALVSHFLFDAATAWLARGTIRKELADAVMERALDHFLADDEAELTSLCEGPRPMDSVELSRPMPPDEYVPNVVIMMDGIPVDDVQRWVQAWGVEVASASPRLTSACRWNVTWPNCPVLKQPNNDLGNWLLVVTQRLNAVVPRPANPTLVMRHHDDMMTAWPIRDVRPWGYNRMRLYIDQQPWTGTKRSMYRDWLQDDERNATQPRKGLTVKIDERLVVKDFPEHREVGELDWASDASAQLAKSRPIFSMDATMLAYQRFSLAFKEAAEGVFWLHCGVVNHCHKTAALAGEVPADVFCFVWVPSFTPAVLSEYCKVLTGPIAFCCGDDMCLIWARCSWAWFADMCKCDRTCGPLVQAMFMSMMMRSGLMLEEAVSYETALTGAFAEYWKDAFESAASPAMTDAVDLAAKFVKREMYTITGHPGTSTVSFSSQLNLWFRVATEMRYVDLPSGNIGEDEAKLWMQTALGHWRTAAADQGHEYDDYTLRPSNGASFVGGRFIVSGDPVGPRVSLQTYRWIPTAMYKPLVVCPNLAPAGIRGRDRYRAWAEMMTHNAAWELSPLGDAVLGAAQRTSAGFQLSAQAQRWYDRKYWFQSEHTAPTPLEYGVSLGEFEAMLLAQPWGGEWAVIAHRECLDWLEGATFPADGPEHLRLFHELRYG